MKSFYSFLCIAALIVFPASAVGVEKVSGFIFLLIILAGFISIYSYRKEIFPLSMEEKKLFFSVSLFYLMTLFITAYLGTGVSTSDRSLAMLLIIPSYIFFKFKPCDKEKYLWSGLVIGAVISAFIGIYQVFGPQQFPRARGVTHPILFGDIALIMGLMSIAGFGWFKKQKKWMVLFPFLALSGGVLASVLSLSRGGWIALFPIGLLYFWYSSRYLPTKKIIAMVAIFVVSLSVIYLIPQTAVQKRVDRTLNNVTQYFDSQSVNDPVRSTSTGTRFEMWKASWILFKQNPVVGIGWDQFKKEAKQLAEKGLVAKSAYAFGHPHNQFLSVMVKGGLLVFIGLMFLILYPALYFYRAIRNNTEPEIHRAALAGLVLIIGFVSFGLTEVMFERSRSANFFSFYLAIYLAMAQKKQGAL